MNEGYYFYTEDLDVGYNGTAVVKGINFGVKKGEIMALIGPNGAGKTTALRTLTRQLPAVSGQVFIGGSKMSDLSEMELSRQMSVVLTDRISTEMMTCRDVVETGRYPYTGTFGLLGSSDKRAVTEAMEQTDTAELAECMFSEISDGQKQRVMLARAVCREPEILLLDEPTSFLDIHYKLTFLEMLDRLRKERNIAVVMSLHETELAGKISDTVLLLKNGECTGIGKPSALLDRHTLTGHFDIPEKLYIKYHG